MKRLFLVFTLAALGLLVSVSPVLAGPPGPPTRGVMEPASDGCPWPDVANDFLAAEGVLKCLPAQIPWSVAPNPEGGLDSGVRIVADPLAAVDGSGAEGWFVFWCQSRVGLQYQVIVTGLAPLTVYGVHVEGLSFTQAGATPVAYHLGQLRTDANGSGALGGVLRLDSGGYEFDIFVGDGSGWQLSVPDDDLVGFAVLR